MNGNGKSKTSHKISDKTSGNTSHSSINTVDTGVYSEFTQHSPVTVQPLSSAPESPNTNGQNTLEHISTDHMENLKLAIDMSLMSPKIEKHSNSKINVMSLAPIISDGNLGKENNNNNYNTNDNDDYVE